MLEKAKKFYERAKEAEQRNRDRYLDDLRFARLGEQWHENDIRNREKDGRPCLTFNKLPSFIRQVVNDARQNKPTINTIPVGADSDKDTAQILDGLIRNIESVSSADVAYDTAIDCAVTGGIGYVRVSIDYAYDDAFDMDICIEQINNPLSVYGDPDSQKSDGSDWNKAMIVSWMPKDEFELKYPKAEKIDWENDFSTAQEWIDEDNVLVAEYFTRTERKKTIYLLSNMSVVDDEYLRDNIEMLDMAGITVVNERETAVMDVMQYIMTGAEVLEENDWPGKYIPIVPVYGDEVNEDGERHLFSLHHQAQDAQRSYNYWRTSAVEKVALDTKAPWIGPAGAFNSDENWATANTVNHPYLEYDGQIAPQKGNYSGVPASDLQMALNANDDMKSIIGIYDASLGSRSNETSGKAILARQREGDVSTFHFIDNMTRAIRQVGRIVVDLIPHVYNRERIVRILHEDGTPEEVAINRKFLQEGLEKIYDLTSGKYDVTVKAGPSFTSRREESANQMMEMIRAFPQSAPVIGDLVAKNLEWPGSDEIADRLKMMLPAQLQGQPSPEIKKQIDQMSEMINKGKQMIDNLTAENNQLKLAVKDKGLDFEIKKLQLQLDALKASAEMQMDAAELQGKSAGLM